MRLDFPLQTASPVWQMQWPFRLVSHMPSSAFIFQGCLDILKTSGCMFGTHFTSDLTYHSRSGRIHGTQPASAFQILRVFTWEEETGLTNIGTFTQRRKDLREGSIF